MICPSCQRSQAHSLVTSGKSRAPSRASSARMRGVSRSSQNVGRKMRWTRRRTRRRRVSRTAKSWRPDTPTLVSSRRRCFGIAICDGGNKPGSPGRPRRKPLKPLRRECRTSPVRPWWTYSVCFFHLHPRLRAQRAPGIPCALSFRRDEDVSNDSRLSARDREAVAV